MDNPTQSNTLISVIVPIFNAEPFLEQCLSSIVEQTHENLEIICLNDGSTDESLETMQRFAQQDSRITIIDKQNQGYGATCNRGLEEATGYYVSIIEPDDWIELDMYRDMLSFAAQFTEKIDVIKSAYWRIWLPDTPQQAKINCSYKNRIHPPTQPFVIKDAAHLLCHHPSIWSALYRRDFLTENAIRFKEIPGAGWADNPFLIETLCQAKNIVYTDKAYYCYREERPEKAAAFAHSNTLLPLERWNDMADVLDRLSVVDKAVWRAHNSRGFTYLSGIIEEVDLSHEEVRDAAIHMFSRMDDDLVFSDPEISPGCKNLYANLLGLPRPKINHLVYYKGLLNQGLYNLKNVGAKNTFFATTNYLRKRKARSGQ